MGPLLALLLSSCTPEGPAAPDASAGLDASQDAGQDAGGQCTAAADCDDGVFCNGAERCEAGACLGATGPACVAGVACDEVADRCGASCDGPDDADGDGHLSLACGGDDCDDTDADAFPGNAEVCDLTGHDEDCDPGTFGERDVDGDRVSDARCCNRDAAGGPRCGEDCDDARRGTNPSVPEVCNGLDDDCDGATDEGVVVEGYVDADRDGAGDADMPTRACAGSAGFTTTAPLDDCADTGPDARRRSPFFPEIGGDGIDNDCDPSTLDGAGEFATWYLDEDGDGFGVATATRRSDRVQAGYALLAGDCADDDAARHPAAEELCNGRDDDCNGAADYRLGVNDLEDDDGDGDGDAACPSGRGTDCDDRSATVFLGAPEVCATGRDENCDGAVDEGCAGCTASASRACGVAVGECSIGAQVCASGTWGGCSGTRPIPEACNGRDDDCDGVVDDGCDAATSCATPGPGRTDCGPAPGENCCTSLRVTGGTFYRSYDGMTFTDMSYPATVSDFRLDKYEITVGRFRQFVAAMEAGWRPTAGAGRHIHLNGGMGLSNSGRGGGFEVGWDAAWTAGLPTTAAAWTEALSCLPTLQTWTSAVGAHEGRALNCMNMYEAQAFCLWDGGFLPSEAEWNFAAAGGSEHRVYPWSSPPDSISIDETRAVYELYEAGRVALVGSTPAGNGRYGQSDLAGNVWEWTLDGFTELYAAGMCTDCSQLLPVSSFGVIRGGSFFYGASDLRAAARLNYPPDSRFNLIGARCARTP